MKILLLGYGYRARYYLNIAKFEPDKYEIVGILVRAGKLEIAKSENPNTEVSTDLNYLLSLKFDFIINALAKNINHSFTKDLLERGYYVLQETPYSIYSEDLTGCHNMNHLMIAEQFPYYPLLQQISNVVKSGMIGKITDITLSYMHDYHAIAYIRDLIGEFSDVDEILGHKYKTKVTKTNDRYKTYTDGSIMTENRKLYNMVINGVNICYDFCATQYRSPIRRPYIIVRGTRGEIFNDSVSYLNDLNLPENINIKYDASLDADIEAIKCVLNNMFDFINGKFEYNVNYAIQDANIALKFV